MSAPRWHVAAVVPVDGLCGLVVYADDTATIETWPPAWAVPGAEVSVLPVPAESSFAIGQIERAIASITELAAECSPTVRSELTWAIKGLRDAVRIAENERAQK